MSIASKQEQLVRIESSLWLVKEAAKMFSDCNCDKLECRECPAGVIWATAEDGTDRKLCDCIIDLLHCEQS